MMKLNLQFFAHKKGDVRAGVAVRDWENIQRVNRVVAVAQMSRSAEQHLFKIRSVNSIHDTLRLTNNPDTLHIDIDGRKILLQSFLKDILHFLLYFTDDFGHFNAETDDDI